MAYAKKKDALKAELARRLSTRLKRFVHVSEILDRKEAAKLAGLSENHFTNGASENFPNYYKVPKRRFGPEGLMLFLRSDVVSRSSWRGEELDWPPKSDELSPADWLKFMREWSN